MLTLHPQNPNPSRDTPVFSQRELLLGRGDIAVTNLSPLSALMKPLGPVGLLTGGGDRWLEEEEELLDKLLPLNWQRQGGGGAVSTLPWQLSKHPLPVPLGTDSGPAGMMGGARGVVVGRARGGVVGGA
jgi:hypothetical protein